MFEKIKRLFSAEPEYTSTRTRVHKKQHSKSNHYWLVVKYDGWTNAIQVPFGTTDSQVKELEKTMVKYIQINKK